MKEEPDSLSVPYNFARCFNDQCPQASKCLRHIATQLDTTDHLYISIVNPHVILRMGISANVLKLL